MVSYLEFCNNDHGLFIYGHDLHFFSFVSKISFKFIKKQNAAWEGLEGNNKVWGECLIDY